MNLPPPIEWVKLFVGIGLVLGLTYIGYYMVADYPCRFFIPLVGIKIQKLKRELTNFLFSFIVGIV